MRDVNFESAEEEGLEKESFSHQTRVLSDGARSVRQAPLWPRQGILRGDCPILLLYRSVSMQVLIQSDQVSTHLGDERESSGGEDEFSGHREGVLVVE